MVERGGVLDSGAWVYGMLTRVLRRLVVMTTQKQTKQYRRDKQAVIHLPVVGLKC